MHGTSILGPCMDGSPLARGSLGFLQSLVGAAMYPTCRCGLSYAAGYAITVSFELENGTADEFRRLVAENARQSVALEPGCIRFDVLHPTDGARSHEVFLYEIYTDQSAFEFHLASPHFKRFDEQTRSMVRRKTVNAFTVVQNAKA
jgi:autoinducer 2-degrading protein